MKKIKKFEELGKSALAFAKILEKIEDYHKKFDEILKDATIVEKSFILGTYIWKIKSEEEKVGKENDA